jgi:ubiquinone/menaquinone biosynthesis C-methylase UbiE
MDTAITKEYLKNLQYGTTANLDARIKIHQLFSTNPESFHAWIGRHLPLTKPVDVLEVGCGTGIFWKENLPRLPVGSTLTLTDFSQAMVEKTRTKLGDAAAKVETADVENLAYDDDSFDLVNAHHIIYHAQDKPRAFSEIKRVLRPDGFVTFTTNSKIHMFNVYEIGRRLDANFPTDRIIDSFTEEVADKMLPQFFGNIEKHVQQDTLEVTDIQFMLDYVASGVKPRDMSVADDFFERYAAVIQAEMDEKGYFGIPKQSPLFICRP